MTAGGHDRRRRPPRDAGRWARAEPARPRTPVPPGPPDIPDEMLHPRDRGPVRAHVRDLVDARRGPVGLFLPALGGTLIAALGPGSDLQRLLLLVCGVALAVTVVDAVVLGRSVVRRARARFPGGPVDGLRTGWYAFVRAHRTRGLRRPPPRVTPGTPVP